jgi:hypothetical protein
VAFCQVQALAAKMIEGMIEAIWTGPYGWQRSEQQNNLPSIPKEQHQLLSYIIERVNAMDH